MSGSEFKYIFVCFPTSEILLQMTQINLFTKCDRQVKDEKHSVIGYKCTFTLPGKIHALSLDFI